MLYLCIYVDSGWKGDEYEGEFPGTVRIGIYEAATAGKARSLMAHKCAVEGEVMTEAKKKIQATPVNGDPLEIPQVRRA